MKVNKSLVKHNNRIKFFVCCILAISLLFPITVCAEENTFFKNAPEDVTTSIGLDPETMEDTVTNNVTEGVATRTVGVWQEATSLIAYDFLQNFRPAMETFYSYFGITDVTRNWLKTGTNYNIYGYATSNDDFISLFKIVGYVIATLLYAWNLFTMLFGPLTENRESPLKLTAKYGITLFVVHFSEHLMSILSVIALRLWDYIASIDLSDSEALEGLLNPFDVFRVNFSISGFFSIILGIGFGWAMLKQVVRLLLEIIERYIVYSLLMIMSPMGLSTFVSKSSENIGKSYLQMYISELILLVSNLWFVRMFFRLVNNPNMGSDQILQNVQTMLFVLAFLTVAQRMDFYMKSMGLSTAITGGGVAMSARECVRTMQGITRATGYAIKTGNKIAGKGAYNAGIKTGSTSLMKLGQVLGGGTGSRAAGSAQQQLLNAQVNKGCPISATYDKGMWRAGANGSLKNATALSSNTINDGLRKYMGKDFNNNNQQISNLRASNNGDIIKGTSTLQLSGGLTKDVGFTLSRTASLGSENYTDLLGNSWYMSYDQNDAKLNVGEAISTEDHNFTPLTGLSLNEIESINPAFSAQDCIAAERMGDGLVLRNADGDIMAKALDNGSYYWNTDSALDASDFTGAHPAYDIGLQNVNVSDMGNGRYHVEGKDDNGDTKAYDLENLAVYDSSDYNKSKILQPEETDSDRATYGMEASKPNSTN